MDKAKRATHEGPLIISGIEIPASVLEDGTRLISQRGLQTSIGLSKGGATTAGVRRVGVFLTRIQDKGIDIHDLTARIENPIIFQPSHGGRTAYGYEATILADICDVVFEANKQDKLLPQQKHLAKQCEMLMRAFAKVGIIALIDEATGYQEVRDRLALQKILEKYLREEYAKWARTFPDEFYENLFRLRGWQYRPLTLKKPGVVGHLTNDLIYKRLAPGVLDELKKKNPIVAPGQRRQRHHQWLTEDVGHPRLREHLAAVMALMKASTKWSTFYRSIQRALPQYGNTIPLELGEPEDE